jgi:hypothetical protein
MKRFLMVFLGLLLVFGLATLSWAGYELKIDDNTKLVIDPRAHIWAQIAGDAAPDGSDAIDFSIRTFRLTLAGQVTPIVKFVTNIDANRGRFDGGAITDAITLRDCLINFDIAPEFKAFAGLYRMPFSRVSHELWPFVWIFPHIPEVAGGSYVTSLRDFRGAGLTLWGEPLGGKIRYNLGIFDNHLTPGISAGGGAMSADDSPTLVARIHVSPLEPEKGYWYAMTHLGKKKAPVLTIGVGYLTSGYTAAGDSKTYTAQTVDVFTEIPLAGGSALTAEGAYFIYDRDITDGETNAYYASVAYLMPVAGMKLQPGIRYEDSDRDGTVVGGEDFTKTTLVVNLYLKDHSAKVALEYGMKRYDNEGTTPRTERDYNDLTLALQWDF